MKYIEIAVRLVDTTSRERIEVSRVIARETFEQMEDQRACARLLFDDAMSGVLAAEEEQA